MFVGVKLKHAYRIISLSYSDLKFKAQMSVMCQKRSFVEQQSHGGHGFCGWSFLEQLVMCIGHL
jgi:hypothetical protein